MRRRAFLKRLVSAAATWPLAAARAVVIQDGTTVTMPVFLFTAIGNLSTTCTPGAGNQTGCAPVDVVLAVQNAGTAIFNAPISSDTIIGCTLAVCSTGVVLNSGTCVFNAINSYTGATTVQSGATLIVNGSLVPPSGLTGGPTMVSAGGALIVNGSIAASSGLTVDAGGLVGGTGILPTSVINGKLLARQFDRHHHRARQSHLRIGRHLSGRSLADGRQQHDRQWELGGTVLAMFSPGSYLPNRFTIPHTTGGLGGSTFNTLLTSNLPTNCASTLSYTPTDVVLNLTAALGAGVPLSQNQQNVAGAVNNFFNNGGALPPNFLPLFGLTGANLANAPASSVGQIRPHLEPTKTKLVEFGRFAQRHAGKRGRRRPSTSWV